MDIFEAILILDRYIELDRKVREGKEDDEFNRFCEEKCVAIDTLLEFVMEALYGENINNEYLN